MKTKLSTLSLLFVLFFTVSTFAGDDGTTHSGGKTCPQGQTTCLVDNGDETNDSEIEKYLKDIFAYLGGFFG